MKNIYGSRSGGRKVLACQQAATDKEPVATRFADPVLRNFDERIPDFDITADILERSAVLGPEGTTIHKAILRVGSVRDIDFSGCIIFKVDVGWHVQLRTTTIKWSLDPYGPAILDWVARVVVHHMVDGNGRIGRDIRTGLWNQATGPGCRTGPVAVLHGTKHAARCGSRRKGHGCQPGSGGCQPVASGNWSKDPAPHRCYPVGIRGSDRSGDGAAPGRDGKGYRLARHAIAVLVDHLDAWRRGHGSVDGCRLRVGGEFR